jgi:hypothetical protein
MGLAVMDGEAQHVRADADPGLAWRIWAAAWHGKGEDWQGDGKAVMQRHGLSRRVCRLARRVKAKARRRQGSRGMSGQFWA